MAEEVTSGQIIRKLDQVIAASGGGGGGGAVTIADGADVALGTTTDAAITTSATGTVSGKLRGLISLLVSKIFVKTADGDDVTQGTTTDAAATDSTSAWSTIALLKGLIAKYIPVTSFVSGVTAAITDTTVTDVLAAAGASTYNHITSILVTNSHATQGTFVTIQEETTATVLWEGYAAAVGGGFSCSFPIPIRQPTANKKIQAKCITTGTNVIVNVSGYKAA